MPTGGVSRLPPPGGGREGGTATLIFGTDEPVEPARVLRAGRLETSLRGTRLGPVLFDGHEVWHGADFLYRDTDWGTPRPIVDAVQEDAVEDGFRLHLQGRIGAGGGIDFSLLIEGSERALRYQATATPRADIATQRTGVVLLHPLSACGREVEVEHIDGRLSRSTFPSRIAPWPPFMLVRAIRHAYADGAWASCRFEGDDFELEDQRNNADASFKTYNRSNLMPRGYTLRAGATLQQALELRIESVPMRPASLAPGPVQVRVDAGDAGGPLPSIGTSLTPTQAGLSSGLHGALAALAPSHLHLWLERPDEAMDAGGLARLIAAAGGCALRLDVAGLSAGQARPQLERIAQALAGAGVAPEALAVFPSLPPVLDAARRAFPSARVGGGTPHFFTQLNRIEDLGRVDFLTFTTSAVVHGAEDADIMAGLQSLPAMLESLRRRHGPLPVRVGPAGIGARRSPLGGQPASDGTRRLALARRDPRTRGLYGAAWALGYLAQLAAAGAEAVTLLELLGDAALIEDGVHTPAFELLCSLSGAGRRHAVSVSRPDLVAALAFERDGAVRTLIANLSGQTVEVQCHGLPPSRPWLLMDTAALQARNADPQACAWRPVPAAGGRLGLPPYGVAQA